MKDGARAVTLLCVLLAPDARLGAQGAIPTPPPTRHDNVREVLHGVEIVDPYRWLEDRRAPETRAWIDAQNRYTQALLDGAPGRDAIRDRLSALSRYDMQTDCPIGSGGRYFLRTAPCTTTSRSCTSAKGLTRPTRSCSILTR